MKKTTYYDFELKIPSGSVPTIYETFYIYINKKEKFFLTNQYHELIGSFPTLEKIKSFIDRGIFRYEDFAVDFRTLHTDTRKTLGTYLAEQKWKSPAIYKTHYRNKDIFLMWEEGITYNAIGKEHNISGNRAREIVRKEQRTREKNKEITIFKPLNSIHK